MPAQICHLEDRIGSLEPGKDADFSLFAEDPLSNFAKPRYVYTAGRCVLDRR